MEPLPADAARELEDELEPGEKLVWCGKPHALSFARTSIPIFLFGIIFFSFSVFWEFMALTGTRSMPKGNTQGDAFAFFFPLFGIPFLLIGLSMLLSPLGYIIMAGRTVYGITTKAAIVVRGKLLSGREITRYGPGQLQQMSRTERMGGSGDLVFDSVATNTYWGRGNRRPVMRACGFIGIDNVRDVERTLRSTLLSQ